MHTVFALLCFVVVIHWLIFPYPSGLLHWHCGNLTIAPVPAQQPRRIWINTTCKFIMNDCITTTKQSTTNTCAYFLGYTVVEIIRACMRMALIQNSIAPADFFVKQFQTHIRAYGRYIVPIHVEFCLRLPYVCIVVSDLVVFTHWYEPFSMYLRKKNHCYIHLLFLRVANTSWNS